MSKFNRFSYLSARKTAHMRKAAATYCETNGIEKLPCHFLKAETFSATSSESPITQCITGATAASEVLSHLHDFRAELNKKKLYERKSHFPPNFLSINFLDYNFRQLNELITGVSDLLSALILMKTKDEVKSCG